MLLQRLATGATGVKQALHGTAKFKVPSSALVRACAVYTPSFCAYRALCSTIDSSTMGSKLSLLLLLLFLVEVHSQTFPYVSFGLTGQALANHSYVNLSTVGSASDNSDSVVCHTDLTTCCTGGQGAHRGDWFFPDGTVLPFAGSSVPIGLGRAAQIAIIRRTNDATGPTGIYRCRIATNAVHSDTDQSVGEAVYVGLYPADGGKLKHRLAADINLPIYSISTSKHTSKLHSTFTTAL